MWIIPTGDQMTDKEKLNLYYSLINIGDDYSGKEYLEEYYQKQAIALITSFLKKSEQCKENR
jgi:hypothetical protein